MRSALHTAVALLVAPYLAGCAGLPWTSSDPETEVRAARAEYRRMLEAQRAAEAEAADAVEESETYEQKLRDGDRYRGTGDLRRAVLTYFEAVRLDPNNLSARERMAELELRADPTRAELLFQKLVDEEPESASTWAGLGIARLAQAKLEPARDALVRSLELDASSVLTHSALGATYDRLGLHSQAQEHLVQARALSPGDPTVLNNLGVSYLLSHDLAGAEEAFRKAAALDPDDPVARNNLGLALGLQGRYADSLEAFRRTGTEQSAYNNLGYVYYLNGDPEAAIAQYERALLARGDDELSVVSNMRQARQRADELGIELGGPDAAPPEPEPSRAPTPKGRPSDERRAPVDSATPVETSEPAEAPTEHRSRPNRWIRYNRPG